MKNLSLAELGLQVPHFRLGHTSLEVEQEATEQDYAQIEALLDTVGGSVLWWWGDYLNHLASARGVEYAEAKAASTYSPGALKHASWVCRHVDRCRRRHQLSYSHHLEVAALSPTDQEVWLAQAEENAWSSKHLRAEIRKSKAQVTNGPDQAREDPRAAKASESFEVFSIWYQRESPNFTAEQREEWDKSLEPLMDDWITRNRGHVMLRLKDLGR